MIHDEFSQALLELCDDISRFPQVTSDQVDRLRRGALEKANKDPVSLLSYCIANLSAKERHRTDFYQMVLEAGFVEPEDLNEERTPELGMGPDIWRVQYLTDRIFRYGLVLMILNRINEKDGFLDEPQSVRRLRDPATTNER